MRRMTSVTSILLLLSSASLAETPQPLCVATLDEMPKSWQPTDEVRGTLNPAPWSEAEAQDAVASIDAGLHQMIDHYVKHPGAVEVLWEDSVGSVFEVTFSSVNKPELDMAARAAAQKNLSQLIEPFLKRESKTATCDDYEKLLPLAMYSHRLFAADDARTPAVVALTNAAYQDCGSLKDAIGYDYPKMIASNTSPVDDVFDLVIWSLLFTEIELYPDIIMPEGAREFTPALWKYLENYPLVGATAYEDGAFEDAFIETAYLATHIAYIPTGNHRYPLYIEDSPKLYQFMRENFYAILQMGELDLVAEVVDTFRQYGCNDENDAQVRDGARYLLNLYHSLGNDWSAYREPEETTVDDYDLIHKIWTGISGVRIREWETPAPGNYGGVIRSWLPHPRQ